MSPSLPRLARSHARVFLTATVLGLAACSDSSAPTSPSPTPTKQYAPLPDTARGVPVERAVGYAMEEIRDKLYWVTNGADQAMFLVSSQGVIVVDAPPMLAEGLASAIRKVTSQPITHLVYSHSHADHIGGASRISTTAQVVAHGETARALRRAADPHRPVPTVTFEDSLVLTVGEQTLHLAYQGSNHVPGNIFIYAPRQRTLMLVDIVWPGWVPFTALGQARDVPGYVAALDATLAYDFDTFIGGHIGRYGRREDVEQTRAYVQDLLAEAGAALASVDFNAVAAEVGYENVFLLVDTWFKRISNQCAAAMEKKWVGRLGAADVWADTHCFAAAQSLRID